MTECKHEWYAKDGDTRGIYRCRLCSTTSDVTPVPLSEYRIREIVREEMRKVDSCMCYPDPGCASLRCERCRGLKI